MCLTIERYRGPAKVAKASMCVYKVFRRFYDMSNHRYMYFSPYFNTIWYRNVEVEDRLTVRYHKLGWFDNLLGYRYVEVEEGLHAFLYLDQARQLAKAFEFATNNEYFVHPVIIPKGAAYFKNKTEIVSTKMMMT